MSCSVVLALLQHSHDNIQLTRDAKRSKKFDEICALQIRSPDASESAVNI